MNTKNNNIKEEIQRIANAIYLKAKENGLEDNPNRDWAKAESIYNNKLRYWWWLRCQFFIKFSHPIIAFIAILSLGVNIGMMTWSIVVNRTSTDLNTRPYVSADIESPIRSVEKNDTFYGNRIVLNNKGKIPAAHISTEYYITTDIDKKNMHGLEWFDKNLGGFGSISFIVPGDPEIEPGFRSLSPSAEYYYFEAITSYEGLELDKKYWTHIKKIFYVEKVTNKLYAVSIYGEWDRNRNFKIPLISTTEKVVKELEEIKKKRISNKN